MEFRDRHDAGSRLARLLVSYRGEPVVVLAVPRGGVPLAAVIARTLKAPLDLLLAHKIGHPLQPEYAIAAVAESGALLTNEREVAQVDARWFAEEKQRQLLLLHDKRERYLPGSAVPDVSGKVALVVDDGIATGLTLRAGLLQLREQHPAKVVIAVPVAPLSTAQSIGPQVDDFIALEEPPDHLFRGAIGAYYDDFSQVEDEEVIALMRQYGIQHSKKDSPR